MRALLLCILLVGCGRDMPPTKDNPPQDLAKVVAEALKDKPVVIVEKPVPMPAEEIKVRGKNIKLCSEITVGPYSPGKAVNAVTEALRAANGEISRCNKIIKELLGE